MTYYVIGADENRPAWLKPWALVEGSISSAPQDLAARMEQVYAGLKRAGWQVAVKSIGTDFGTFLPTPGSQPIALYLHRTDRPYTGLEAEGALASVIRAIGASYSAWARYAGEITTQVIQPTVESVAKVGIGMGTIALAVVAAIYLLPMLKGK